MGPDDTDARLYAGDETIVSDRFEFQEPAEYDVVEDPLSAVMYRIIDTDGGANTPVAYAKTLADATFVTRLLNAGELLKKEVTLTFLNLKKGKPPTS
jgi:hypothetical protein